MYQVRVVFGSFAVTSDFDCLENANKCWDKNTITIEKYDFPMCMRMINENGVMKECFNKIKEPKTC